eukprot:12910908-Prorocentrum_lima.AAC.1
MKRNPPDLIPPHPGLPPNARWRPTRARCSSMTPCRTRNVLLMNLEMTWACLRHPAKKVVLLTTFRKI